MSEECTCPRDPDAEVDPGDPISTCPVHGWAVEAQAETKENEDGSIELSWSPVEDATSYSVWSPGNRKLPPRAREGMT